MNKKATPESVNADLSRLLRQRDEAVDNIESLVKLWQANAAPFVEVLKNHRVPFKNQYVEGQTIHGIVVGADAEGKPLVLIDDSIYAVDPVLDALGAVEVTTLKRFIRTAALEVLKAGFDYVRGVQSRVVDPLEDKVVDLLKFYNQYGKVR